MQPHHEQADPVGHDEGAVLDRIESLLDAIAERLNTLEADDADG